MFRRNKTKQNTKHRNRFSPQFTDQKCLLVSFVVLNRNTTCETFVFYFLHSEHVANVHLTGVSKNRNIPQVMPDIALGGVPEQNTNRRMNNEKQHLHPARH